MDKLELEISLPIIPIRYLLEKSISNCFDARYVDSLTHIGRLYKRDVIISMLPFSDDHKKKERRN